MLFAIYRLSLGTLLTKDVHQGHFKRGLKSMQSTSERQETKYSRCTPNSLSSSEEQKSGYVVGYPSGIRDWLVKGEGYFR
jgi:hypothetical protein